VYIEELYQRDAKDSGPEESGDHRMKRVPLGQYKLDGDYFRAAPWIERVYGDQGRGVGSRVWKVRRDLGKSWDGD